jgi:hypothetical protein
VKALWWMLALALSAPAFAQEQAPEKKPAAKKQVTQKQQSSALKPKAHSKPTPEQIRKFNELEKKQKAQ